MPAVDTFEGRSASVDQPATNGFAVTPHDTNELAFVTRAIMVGVDGNVKVTTSGGDTLTLPALAAGQIYPVRAKVIFAAGTTATGIIGLY